VNIHLNNEGQECKQVLWGEGVLAEGRVNREGKEGQIWSVYFIYMYEDIALKPVRIILSRGKEMRQ
jgi:hypothetical protein